MLREWATFYRLEDEAADEAHAVLCSAACGFKIVPDRFRRLTRLAAERVKPLKTDQIRDRLAASGFKRR